MVTPHDCGLPDKSSEPNALTETVSLHISDVYVFSKCHTS